jgi:two-component system sensor histidine kinase RpfC
MAITGKIQGGQEFAYNIRMQAWLRVVLGCPVTILIWLALRHLGDVPFADGMRDLIAICSTYTAYALVTLYLAFRPWPLTLRQLVLMTAILDPLWLSGFLALLGEEGQLFICFYLFTILGFGLRVGTRPMWICVGSTLLGYGMAIWMSSAWRERPLIALSNVLLLIILPMYATLLVEKLRAARARAEQESRAKTQLLANVSHELRTPLTGIVSSAQLVRDAAAEVSMVSLAETILRLSGNLMVEIDNLLDSAKYEAGALNIDKACFHLGEVMEQVRVTLAPTAIAKGITLSVTMDESIHEMVEGNPHYLCRVMMNIGGNAVKFTDRGRVEINLSLIDETQQSYLLRFSCKDTGIGIAPELHQKIFEPFYQVSTGTSRKYGGTGLGMSIARDVVAMMGGQLSLQSEPGKGSLFCFELRMSKIHLAAPTGAAVAPPTVVYGKRILIADDHRTNLMLLKEILERDRHMVRTAESGEEAVSLLSSESFDVIFLDVNLGDIDGATVMRIYRFGGKDPVPVYFFTADATAATAERLQKYGAVGVLTKPITREGLRWAIAAVLRAEPAATPERDA